MQFQYWDVSYPIFPQFSVFLDYFLYWVKIINKIYCSSVIKRCTPSGMNIWQLDTMSFLNLHFFKTPLLDIDNVFVYARVSYEKFELNKSHHSPWSVNGISVKIQSLNFCLHLPLDQNQFPSVSVQCDYLMKQW